MRPSGERLQAPSPTSRSGGRTSTVCAPSSRSATRPTTDGLLAPQYVIQRIGELTDPEGIFASGVGQHQMWAAQFIKYERPNAWLNSGGAGTMGYSVPAAMGAKVAQPERPVWRSTATAASR